MPTIVITTTGAGQWTVPAGVTSVTVELWSGGQGGGDYPGGGRGGNYVAHQALAVSPGASVSYAIGAGGAGGAYTTTNGGDTWFGSATTLLAKGGGATSGNIGPTSFYGGAGDATWAANTGAGSGGGGAAGPHGSGGAASAYPTPSPPVAGASGGNTIAGASHPDGGAGGLNTGSGGAPGGGGGSRGVYGGGVSGNGGRGQVRLTYAVEAADTTAPIISTSSIQAVNENAAFTLTLAANEPVTWTKSGGDDQALFTLSGATLSMSAKDYENPADANQNNVYIVVVRATDAAGNVGEKAIYVEVLNVNEVPVDTSPPTITSASAVFVPENTVNPSGTLTADETVAWSKVGGADASAFSLSGSTWTLNATPDYEAKNSYVVIWRATDPAGNTTNQTMTLGITDVDETPPPEPVEEVVTYTANHEFTVQPGVSSIEFQAHGGGGAGGMSAPSGTSIGGTGGGGGGYSAGTISVAPGDFIQITVGQGGLGTNVPTTAGGDGGDTIVRRNGTIVVHARGGRGGPYRSGQIDWNDGALGGQGGQANLGVGAIRWSGGAGWCGSQYGLGGGGAGAASPSGNGSNGSYSNGGAAGPGGAPGTTEPGYFDPKPDGASHPLGGGGGPGGQNHSTPKWTSHGGNPGGGGGGTGRPNGSEASGNGGRGQVVVIQSITQVIKRAQRKFYWL